MASGGISVMKEFHKLLQKADRLYDGQVEFVLDEKEIDDNEREFEVFFFITPNDGIYKNARIKFRMRVELDQYPQEPPTIKCRNSIYHPNINPMYEYEEESDICVNLLDSDWQPEVGLEGAVMAVLFLFYNPQLDDALNGVFQHADDEEGFEEFVKLALRGRKAIDEYYFEKLIDDEDNDNEEKEQNNTTAAASTADTDTSNAGTTGSEDNGEDIGPVTVCDNVENTISNTPLAESETVLATGQDTNCDSLVPPLVAESADVVLTKTTIVGEKELANEMNVEEETPAINAILEHDLSVATIIDGIAPPTSSTYYDNVNKAELAIHTTERVENVEVGESHATRAAKPFRSAVKQWVYGFKNKCHRFLTGLRTKS